MLAGNLEQAERALREGGDPDAKVSLRYVLSKAGGGGWGFLFLLLTLPNILVIPSIPGLPFVAGIPAMWAALMFALGREADEMPERVGSLRIKRRHAIRCLRAARWASFMADPSRRPEWTEGRVPRLVLGLLAASMTFLLCLPLPLINVPVGLSTLLLAMGMAGRDGVLSWVAAGLGVLSALFMFTALSGILSGTGLLP